MSKTIFIKLGGSLITDKSSQASPQTKIIARLAAEVRQALNAKSHLSLLLGHGSGSFGHWEAKHYGTRNGVDGESEWSGYAKVGAAAARLNRIVTDAFMHAKLPVLVLQPSASAHCHDGQLVSLETYPIERALEVGLVPLVYGDVALDDVRGGTIISTEEIFAYLAKQLRPQRILLLGKSQGVHDAEGKTIPLITPDNIAEINQSLKGSSSIDVTGGMFSKVQQMLDLVVSLPGSKVRIFSGLQAGLLTEALLNPNLDVGTQISGTSSDKL